MTRQQWRRELGTGFVIGRPNPQMRDRLLRSARQSLLAAEASLSIDPSPAAVQAENAVRLAINALAADDGVRIDSPNKHAAVVEYITIRPKAFDARTTNAVDQLRQTRNEALYGDYRAEWPAPVEVDRATAEGSIALAGRVIRRVATLTARPVPPPPGMDASTGIDDT